MKLKKYEVDAITNTIFSKIKEGLKIPDFTKSIDEKEKAHNKILKLRDQIDSINSEIRKITFKYDTYGYSKQFDRKIVEKQELNKFIASKLPNKTEIENMVILSNNKDLSTIVEEIVSIYSK